MTEYDLGKVVGDDGEAGNGIASITKTGTSGLVDTYTITYDDGTTTTFTVTNGSNASVTIQTSWGSTTSDSKVPSEKLTKDTLDTKIAKSSTSGLVKNDGTIDTNTYLTSSALTNYVQKSSTTGLIKNDGSIMTSGTGSSNYSAGNHTHSGYVSATKVTSWSGTVSDSNVPSEKLVKNSLDDKIGKSSTSGLVKNDGTIDTSSYLTSSALSNYMQKSSTSGLMKNDGTVDTTSYSTFSGSYNDLSGKPTIPTKTSDLTNDGDGTNVFVKNNDSRLTDARTPTSHTHGNLTNDGKLGTTSGKPVITTTGGAITTGSFGTGSGTFAEGNHTHSGYISTSSTTGLVKNDGTIMTSGTGSTNYAAGNHTHSGYVSATKVTSWQSTPSDSNVPSEKLVKDYVDGLIGSAISYIVGSGS